MRHNIDSEDWIPWTDVEKMYHITKAQLDQAVKDRLVRSKTLQYDNSPYVYDVYAEADIQLGIANHKFVEKVKVEEWFDR
jgi:hypothetical protein